MTAEQRDYVKRSLFSWRASPAVARADVMCGAGTKIYSLFNFFFFLLVWLQEEDGGWAGSAGQGTACGFHQGRVAVNYLGASDLQG